MLIDDLSQLPDQFKLGIRGVMLLHRNKDGCEGNAQRKSIKRITSNVDEWNAAIEELVYLRERLNPDYRIYSSVNARDYDKAVREFKLRQLHADYDQNENKYNFYFDIENRFFSCLMNPSCKVQSNFLIDCDSLEEYLRALNNIPEECFIFEYNTKNGWHIITRPFNPKEYDVEIKKDDLIYIG